MPGIRLIPFILSLCTWLYQVLEVYRCLHGFHTPLPSPPLLSSFRLIYPRLGAEEARHSGCCQRRLSREPGSHPHQAIMSLPTLLYWWTPREELGLLPLLVRKEAVPALAPLASLRWCQREPAKIESLC